ncbi:MAG TPA: hypothetical protein VNK52_06205 [Hyphomicrobiaceae bacterium]|nr:hypothetical protein [Hyphomicrobiaceae bacterium]
MATGGGELVVGGQPTGGREPQMAWTLIGMLGIGASLALLVVTAAARSSSVDMAYANMAIAAAASTVFALVAMRDNLALRRAGAAKSAIASSTARHMGIVWIWGALALAVTYATGVLVWREWWHFLLAFAAVGGLCLFFAAMLEKDARAGREDATMLRLGRQLAIIQLAGMVIAVLGLLIDGKMTRFLNPRYTDWAANNVFFFGAVAIAVISANALRPVRA